jgi:tRNA 2-thiocytidine biosynthesis protein TtcA
VKFPIVPCDLCGSQDNLQRKIVGDMINDWESRRPGTKSVMLAALQNVRPSQLYDAGLWKALGLDVALPVEETAGTIPAHRLSRGKSEVGAP